MRQHCQIAEAEEAQLEHNSVDSVLLGIVGHVGTRQWLRDVNRPLNRHRARRSDANLDGKP